MRRVELRHASVQLQDSWGALLLGLALHGRLRAAVRLQGLSLHVAAAAPSSQAHKHRSASKAHTHTSKAAKLPARLISLLPGLSLSVEDTQIVHEGLGLVVRPSGLSVRSTSENSGVLTAVELKPITLTVLAPESESREGGVA